MAKIIKLTGYLVVHDNVSERELESAAGEILGCKFDGIPKHFTTESVSLGKELFWDESWNNHPLNQINCPLAECEKYFIKGDDENDSIRPS